MKNNMKTVGVALGGGGARGLAHVLALETIDACGIRPTVLSGTSMGAIVGALYAAGQSGEQIRKGIERHIITDDDDFRGVLSKMPKLLKWLNFARTDLRGGGFLKVDGFMKYLFTEMGATTFEELTIPLYVVATDFWSGKEVIFSSGDLQPALMASMAIPGVFSPVVINGRVLVDGGIVNNVPYDLLVNKCDCSIAIDVAPIRSPDECKMPSIIESTVGMFDVLVEKVMESKREKGSPSIYIQPNIADVRVLDFDKIVSVFDQSLEAMSDLKLQLERTEGLTP